jgi:HPt (histidine-containing phosphotransfer) domain-containing protein
MGSALPDKDVLDLTNLEEAFEDDVAGIAELLEMALATGAKHCAALADGLARGDSEVVRKAAHSIKGSAGNIGALSVMHLASELQERARAGSLAGARELVDAIAVGYAAVAREVRAYRDRVG